MKARDNYAKVALDYAINDKIKKILILYGVN